MQEEVKKRVISLVNSGNVWELKNLVDLEFAKENPAFSGNIVTRLLDKEIDGLHEMEIFDLIKVLCHDEDFIEDTCYDECYSCEAHLDKRYYLIHGIKHSAPLGMSGNCGYGIKICCETCFKRGLYMFALKNYWALPTLRYHGHDFKDHIKSYKSKYEDEIKKFKTKRYFKINYYDKRHIVESDDGLYIE